jgi:hypothetical protein
LSTATTKRRKSRRVVCVPVYLAVINGSSGDAPRAGLANLDRSLAEQFCTSFNEMSSSRATVHTVRVRVPIDGGEGKPVDLLRLKGGAAC